MRGPFSLIGTAVSYARTQKTLVGITVWLLILPNVIVQMLSTMMEQRTNGTIDAIASPQQSTFALLAIVTMLGCSVVLLWGGACVILIGRKLVHSRAGRKRSSVRSVMGEARTSIIPLILTSILRGCFTFLWSLLFIIPGVIYSIRTAFYSIVVVTEGTSYRAALRRSSEAVRGHTWKALWRLIAIYCALFLPVHLLSIVLHEVGEGGGIVFTLAANALTGALTAPVTVLSIFATMAMYDELKRP